MICHNDVFVGDAPYSDKYKSETDKINKQLDGGSS